MNYKIIRLKVTIMTLSALILIIGCNDKSDPIAAYSGDSMLQQISIEKNSYNPKITWLGGYVSTLAVNKGNEAKVDSTLIWMVHAANNNVTYPATYGIVKSLEESLTELYGGMVQTNLEEDNLYTFWAAKENLWNILATNTNKTIVIDNLLTEDEINLSVDSIYVSLKSYSQITYSLDVFLNLDESSIQNRGRLGTIFVAQTDTSNNLNITWEFVDQSITDLNISAIGICEGQQFDINMQVWDMYSLEQVGGENIYGSINLISQPLSLGDLIEGTSVFNEFPSEGLERNKNYYLWIATKDWDGESRGRTANGYATINFSTW